MRRDHGEFAIAFFTNPTLLLAKESGGDISHVSFLQLVVLATVLIDANVIERLHHSVHVKSHVDEAIDQIFAVALIPARHVMSVTNSTLSRPDSGFDLFQIAAQNTRTSSDRLSFYRPAWLARS